MKLSTVCGSRRAKGRDWLLLQSNPARRFTLTHPTFARFGITHSCGRFFRRGEKPHLRHWFCGPRRKHIFIVTLGNIPHSFSCPNTRIRNLLHHSTPIRGGV